MSEQLMPLEELDALEEKHRIYMDEEEHRLMTTARAAHRLQEEVEKLKAEKEELKRYAEAQTKAMAKVLGCAPSDEVVLIEAARVKEEVAGYRRYVGEVVEALGGALYGGVGSVGGLTPEVLVREAAAAIEKLRVDLLCAKELNKKYEQLVKSSNDISERREVENEELKHDIDRHLTICSELATENEALRQYKELALECYDIWLHGRSHGTGLHAVMRKIAAMKNGGD